MTEPGEGREVWRVNVFTDQPFAGNPAGVVPAAQGLTDADMRRIAGELNDLSETAFILPASRAEADLGLRYFTPTTEVDLCGHATIAALFALAWMGRLKGGDETRVIHAETAVGLLELGLEFKAGQLVSATMEQPRPELATATGAARASEVLGLAPRQIAKTPAIGCCSTGLWVCYVPLTDLEALAAVRIQPSLIESLWPENKALCGVYAFTFLAARTTRGRFFLAPRYGIFEDPVTGTASGGLAAYLMDRGMLKSDQQLLAHQGVEMGRAGRVRAWRNPNGRMAISGQAAPIYRGRLLT